MSCRLVRWLLGLYWALTWMPSALPADEPPPLRVATFRCDVTPPPGGHPLIWVTPIRTIEDPLWAKGIVLEQGGLRCVLCAVDWCGLCNSTHRLFREKIAAAAGVDVSHVAVQTVHQHTAPYTDGDAQRLFDATKHPLRFADLRFLDQVTDRLAAAVKASLARFQVADRVGVGQAKVERVASSRRIITPDGKFHGRMSSAKDPALRALPEGRVDPILRTITLARGDRPIVRLHYYATHPQSFYGDARASADVPGMARDRLQKKENVEQIYFTGCAGDVAMGKYNDGSRQARAELAERLYAGMAASAASTAYRPAGPIAWRSLPVMLPLPADVDARLAKDRITLADATANPVQRSLAACRVAFASRVKEPLELSCLQMGDLSLLHLPGECMVEYQLYSQSRKPRATVAVAAYGDLGPGYICTEQAFREGGYEPSASHVAPQAEAVLKRAIDQLLAPGVRGAAPGASPAAQRRSSPTRRSERLPAPCFAASAEKNRPREIRTGGYVEKVDPTVDYKNRLPRIAPRSPAEAMASFHIIPGWRIEQVAAEPLVHDPVDMTFDENGRLWVIELTNYPEQEPNNLGKVLILDDTDHDGRMDRRTVFADGISWPTSVLPFDGGAFVTAAPDLLYLKDTDGDGRADVREVLFTGFGTGNVNAFPNSLRWGLDNRVQVMTSLSGGVLEAVRWNRRDPARKPVRFQSRGRDFSFDPRTGEPRMESGGSQYGMTFDDWGRKFESSNSAPIEMVMYEDRYVARNPLLAAPGSRIPIWTHGMTVYRTSPPEPWRVIRTEMRIKGVFSGPVEGGGKPAGYFTSACGVTIYTGSAWPEAFRGNAFVCEGAGNLVHRMALEPLGVASAAHRTEENREFLASDDVWFRPVQFCNAPDGTLYLADMYREVFEIPDAIPPSVRKYLDLSAGRDRGRIYRFLPEGFRQPPPTRLGSLPTAGLAALLEHPNGWHRETASRLLYERQDRKAVPPLEKLAAQSPSPLGRMHAMYALDGLGALSADVILARLADPHPRVREHAVRLAERVLADAATVRERLYAMADDEDPRVRCQLAFTLGEIPGPRATAALAAIAARGATDRWVRLAVLSSSLGRAGALLARLCDDPAWRTSSPARGLLESIAEQAGLQARADQVAEVLKLLDHLGTDDPSLARSLVRGLNQGLSRSGSPLRSQMASGGKAGQLLVQIVAQAKATAREEKRPAAERIEAVRSLAFAPWDEVRGVLAEMLDSRQPGDVQRAALAALGHFSGPDVARAILPAWPRFSPQVRGEAAEVLFSRRERIDELLSAVERGEVQPGQIDPPRVQILLAHPDPALRARAERLLGGQRLSPRKQVIDAYREVLTWKGDAVKGKAVFKRDCATCHRLEGVGFETGLPLTTVQNRGREFILLNILDPNSQVLPQYVNYTVLTDSGLTVTGLIESETATSLTLRRAEGVTETILRENIDQLQSTGQSLMPEGLEKQVPKKDMADLLEYLMTVP